MQPGHDVTCTYTAWHWDAAPPEAPARLSRSVRDPVRDRRPSLVAADGPQPATAVTPACLAMKPTSRATPPAWAARQYRSQTIRSRARNEEAAMAR
jgi:hypothetical protein